jgi:hypothetical protein
MLFHVLAAIVEHDLIAERTRDGLAAACARHGGKLPPRGRRSARTGGRPGSRRVRAQGKALRPGNGADVRSRLIPRLNRDVSWAS